MSSTTTDDSPPHATNPITPIDLPPSPTASRRTPSVTSSATSSRKAHRTTSDRKKEKNHNCERTCHRDLTKLLVYEERETRDLTHLLRQLNDQLAKERDRADDAERRLAEVFDSIKVVNEARMLAAAQASHAREELAMYKVRWTEAHQEVVRAQKMLEDLDRRRQDAEEEAAKMRTMVREMREDRLINNAREEGRQLGLSEGLRTRGLMPRASRRRYRTPSSSEGDEESEGEEEHGGVSEAESRKTGYSHAPSISAMSRMSVPLRTPYLTSGRAPSSEASQSRPISPNDVPAPTPIRNSPASHHGPFSIPPDGWIPETGRDSYIHIPPPHELSKPVLSPEVSPGDQAAPSLPVEPPSVATPGRRRQHGHTSSPESNHSTALSELDLVQPNLRTKLSTAHLDGHGTNGKSPLSVITEVLSTHSASPNPLPAPAPPPPPPIVVSSQEGYYRRPLGSDCSSTASSPQLAPKSKSRRSSSATVPDINILPPSRPVSDSSGHPSHPGLERYPSSSSLLLSPAAAMSPAPVQVPPPVPGAYSDSGYLYSPPVAHTPMTPGEPPVIPSASLRKQAGEGSFESGSTTPSSGMSGETLTTPPHYTRMLNGSLSSPVYTEARVPMPASTMGGMTPKAFSQVGSVYTEARHPLPPSTVGMMTPKASSQFGGSVYTEARMPLPPSELGRMTPKTPSVLGSFIRSKKGSISSSRR